MQEIYILHEFGIPAHYEALKNSHNRLIFREFSYLKGFILGLKKKDKALFIKQFINMAFLIYLIFTKNKKIIIGIAPFNYKLLFLLPFLKKHNIYYHTSWANWDGSFVPHCNFLSTIKFTKSTWKSFLECNVKSIFCVTNAAKMSLQNNYSIRSKIHVVYHCISTPFENNKLNVPDKRKLKIIYSGRLEHSKGLLDIIQIAKRFPEIEFTLVGAGSLEQTLVKISKEHPNIIIVPYINDKFKLVELLKKHQIILMPSRKINNNKTNWEELFGISIIEGMACGCCPIATRHSGPLEIITDNINGYLFKEEYYIQDTIDTITLLLNDTNKLSEIREECIKTAKKYYKEQISSIWRNEFPTY